MNIVFLLTQDPIIGLSLSNAYCCSVNSKSHSSVNFYLFLMLKFILTSESRTRLDPNIWWHYYVSRPDYVIYMTLCVLATIILILHVRTLILERLSDLLQVILLKSGSVQYWIQASHDLWSVLLIVTFCQSFLGRLLLVSAYGTNSKSWCSRKSLEY